MGGWPISQERPLWSPPLAAGSQWVGSPASEVDEVGVFLCNQSKW